MLYLKSIRMGHGKAVALFKEPGILQLELLKFGWILNVL